MAKKQHEEVNTDGWKDTYGDMVTLLLCFFVLLYSMSSVNSEKWEKFVQAFNPGEDTNQVVMVPGDEGEQTVQGETPNDSSNIDPTDEYPSSFDELYQALKEYVEANNMQDSVEISGEDGIVYIRYQNSLFFAADKATLLPESYPSLEFLGKSLKSLENQIWLISISGHTAKVPGASELEGTNWELSSRRAAAVAMYLEGTAGINARLIRPIGFGGNYPIESNDTSEGRARNRRVEMVIISNDSAIAQNETTASAVSGLFDHEDFVQAPTPDNLEDLLDPSRMGEGTPDSGAAESGAANSGAASEPAAGGEAGGPAAPEEGGETADAGSAAGTPPEGQQLNTGEDEG